MSRVDSSEKSQALILPNCYATDVDQILANGHSEQLQKSDMEVKKYSRVKQTYGVRVSAGLQKAGRDVQGFCSEIREGAMSVDCRGACRRTCTCQNFMNKFPIIKWLPKYR